MRQHPVPLESVWLQLHAVIRLLLPLSRRWRCLEHRILNQGIYFYQRQCATQLTVLNLQESANKGNRDMHQLLRLEAKGSSAPSYLVHVSQSDAAYSVIGFGLVDAARSLDW